LKQFWSSFGAVLEQFLEQFFLSPGSLRAPGRAARQERRNCAEVAKKLPKNCPETAEKMLRKLLQNYLNISLRNCSGPAPRGARAECAWLCRRTIGMPEPEFC
jgi:hypothetical protein